MSVAQTGLDQHFSQHFLDLTPLPAMATVPTSKLQHATDTFRQLTVFPFLCHNSSLGFELPPTDSVGNGAVALG